MTENYKRRITLYAVAAIMSMFAVTLTVFNSVQANFEPKVQVYKGDVVKFKWTPDNVFYSKTCTDYGTAIDQYGGGNHPAYKVMIVCTSKNKVEFIPLLIQPQHVVSSSGELLSMPADDLVE
jgi:hypothetical protein